MANGHGGARIGAGGKRKPLADKILDGNPGKRKLSIIDFDNVSELTGQDMPPPTEFMAARQKNGRDLYATEIYEQTWSWLKQRGCVHLVNPQLIEQYAMMVSRWIQCEEGISEFGLLAKHPTTGNAMASPYVSASLNFMKQANNIWLQIYQVVRDNCSQEYSGANPHDDAMERLLSARKGK